MYTIVSSAVSNALLAPRTAIVIEVVDGEGSVRQLARAFESGEIAIRMMSLLSGSEIAPAELAAWSQVEPIEDLELADELSTITANRDRTEMMEMAGNDEPEPAMSGDAEMPLRGRR